MSSCLFIYPSFPPCSWDRKNNPEPWNKLAPTDQYKVCLITPLEVLLIVLFCAVKPPALCGWQSAQCMDLCQKKIYPAESNKPFLSWLILPGENLSTGLM